MGNKNSSNGNHLIRLGPTSDLVPLFEFQLSHHYPVTQPQTVTIEGSPILCTVELSDGTIIINDDYHLITIYGTDNKIVVNGSGITLRLEGDGTNVGGTGKNLWIYTDSTITLNMFELEGGHQLKLRDEMGNVVEDAPKALKLADAVTGSGDDGMRCIRYSYTAAARRDQDGDDDFEDEQGEDSDAGSDDDENEDAEENEEDEENEDAEENEEDEENEENDPLNEQSNEQQNPSVKRNTDEDTPDSPQPKKSKK